MRRVGPCTIPCHYLCSQGVKGLFVTNESVDIARITLNAIEIVEANNVVKRIIKVTTSLYGGCRASPENICRGCLSSLEVLVGRNINGSNFPRTRDVSWYGCVCRRGICGVVAVVRF